MDYSTSYWIGVMIGGTIMGLITMAVAKSKGRGAGEGFLLGFLLGLIGLIIEACLARKDGNNASSNVKCSNCGSNVPASSGFCPSCGMKFE